MNKKVLLILIFVIVIGIIAAIGGIIFIKNSDKSYKLEEVTSFDYFKLYENNKYGVIDKNGKIIIEAKYENVDIPNPSKAVFIVYSNYNSQNGEYQTQVLNEKNEKILTEYETVLPIQLKESNSSVSYEKSVLVYKENNKYGIINYNGKKITNPVYDSIDSVLYKEGSLLVKVDGKYGIITIEGKEVVKPLYDLINADGYYENETKYQKAGFVVGIKKEEGYRYGYINNNAKILLDTEYNEISRITEIEENDIYLIASKNGQAGVYKNQTTILNHSYQEIEFNRTNKLFIVKKNDKQGVFDYKGNQVLKPEYDYIMVSGNKINAEKEQILYVYDVNGNREDISNKTVIYADNDNYFITIDEQGKFGIIDKNNLTVIENNYQYIEYAFDNYFIVSENGKVGVIEINKEIKIDFEYDVIQKIKNTKVLQAIKADENISEFYNSKLEKVISMENVTVTEEENYIKLLNTNERKYLSLDGNILNNKEIFKDSNLFAYEDAGKWGFVDNTGNIKVIANYDMVTELNFYGYAGIQKDGKWGVVDKEGNIIINPVYEINWSEPEFLDKFVKINFGYGFYYFTTDIGQ